MLEVGGEEVVELFIRAGEALARLAEGCGRWLEVRPCTGGDSGEEGSHVFDVVLVLVAFALATGCREEGAAEEHGRHRGTATDDDDEGTVVVGGEDGSKRKREEDECRLSYRSEMGSH